MAHPAEDPHGFIAKGASLSHLGFPEVIYLGVKVGEWPLLAFINETQAARWLSEYTGPNDRRRNVLRVNLVTGESEPVRLHTIPEQNLLLTTEQYEALTAEKE